MLNLIFPTHFDVLVANIVVKKQNLSGRIFLSKKITTLKVFLKLMHTTDREEDLRQSRVGCGYCCIVVFFAIQLKFFSKNIVRKRV